MLAVHRRNHVLMKDGACRDAVIEERGLGALGHGSLSRGETKTRVETPFGESTSDTDFAAILFATRKERLLSDSGDTVRHIDE